MGEPAARGAKQRLRRHLLDARKRRDAAWVVGAAAVGLADNVSALVRERDTSTVAAYVSIAGEPSTGRLIERLHAAGVAVLLPVLRADRDLDWAAYVPGAWRSGPFGLVEPTGSLLGVDALCTAGVVCCPGLAGSVTGARLGRGGGSYDRALARTGRDTLLSLLLYDDEVLADIPTEPHDQRVDVLVTPTQVMRTYPRISPPAPPA